MHQAKNRGNKEISLAILSRILAQSCVTLCLNYVGRVTHDCASIVLLRGFPCFHDFSHGAFLHPYSFFLHLFHIFFLVRVYTQLYNTQLRV